MRSFLIDLDTLQQKGNLYISSHSFNRVPFNNRVFNVTLTVEIGSVLKNDNAGPGCIAGAGSANLT